MKKRAVAPGLRWVLDNPYQADLYYERKQQRWMEQQQRPKTPVPEPGLLPPDGPGYGGSTEWPFDFKRALTHTGYRTGIRHALNNVNFHRGWREAARNQLRRVLDYSIRIQQELEEAYRALVEDELYQSDPLFFCCQSAREGLPCDCPEEQQ